MGTVYRPPDGKASLAIDTLNDILSSFAEIKVVPEIVILGDFNIDYEKNTITECKYLKEFEWNYHFKQYLKNPTRIRFKAPLT